MELEKDCSGKRVNRKVNDEKKDETDSTIDAAGASHKVKR